jgi:hypothetical protein
MNLKNDWPIFFPIDWMIQKLLSPVMSWHFITIYFPFKNNQGEYELVRKPPGIPDGYQLNLKPLFIFQVQPVLLPTGQ